MYDCGRGSKSIEREEAAAAVEGEEKRVGAKGKRARRREGIEQAL